MKIQFKSQKEVASVPWRGKERKKCGDQKGKETDSLQF